MKIIMQNVLTGKRLLCNYAGARLVLLAAAGFALGSVPAVEAFQTSLYASLCRVSISAEDERQIEEGDLPPIAGTLVRVFKTGENASQTDEFVEGWVAPEGIVVVGRRELRGLKLADGEGITIQAVVGLRSYDKEMRGYNPAWTGDIQIAADEIDKRPLPVLELRSADPLPMKITCVAETADGQRPPPELLALQLKWEQPRKIYKAYMTDIADGVAQIWIPGTAATQSFVVKIKSHNLKRWGEGNYYGLRRSETEPFIPAELDKGTVSLILDAKELSVEATVHGEEAAKAYFLEHGDMELYRYTPTPRGFFTGGKPRWHGERDWVGNPRRFRIGDTLVERHWEENLQRWYVATRVIEGDNSLSRGKSLPKEQHTSSWARKTDDGRIVCEFYDVPGGVYWLCMPYMAKLTLEPNILEVPAKDQQPYKVKVVLKGREKAERVSLEGRVVDGQGTPVAFASVNLSSEFTGFTARGKCDAEGRFTIENVPAIDLVARATRHRYTPGEVKLSAESIKKGDVEMKVARLPVVFGVLTDHDGQPLEGASVALYKLPPESSRTVDTIEEVDEKRSADDGRFGLVAEHGQGRYALAVRRMRMTGETAYKEIRVDGTAFECDLQMRKGRPVSVQLTAEDEEDSPRKVLEEPGRSYVVHVYDKSKPPHVCAAGGIPDEEGRIKLFLSPGDYAAVVFIRRNDRENERGYAPLSALPPVSFTVKNADNPGRVEIGIPSGWRNKVLYTGDVNNRSLIRFWSSNSCPWWR